MLSTLGSIFVFKAALYLIARAGSHMYVDGKLVVVFVYLFVLLVAPAIEFQSEHLQHSSCQT